MAEAEPTDAEFRLLYLLAEEIPQYEWLRPLLDEAEERRFRPPPRWRQAVSFVATLVIGAAWMILDHI